MWGFAPLWHQYFYVMQTDSHALLADLTQRTRKLLLVVERDLVPLSEGELNHKPGPGRWSALECIAHLNRYGEFYLPELERALQAGRGKRVDKSFRSGWLGNYFAESMLPKNGKIKKMKTPAGMNPEGSQLSTNELQLFIKQLNKILEYLNSADEVDLTRTKTGISLSKFIKLRLGDTLRFVVYHNERHVGQAGRAVQTAKER